MATKPRIPGPSVPVVGPNGLVDKEWYRFFSGLPVIYDGTSAPAADLGVDGDFYLRRGGAAGSDTAIYHKESGAWVALVTS